MKADWFEMKEIRGRRIADAVWIPLRVAETIVEEGEYGYPGYLKEFFGLGSLAVPLSKRAAAQKLGWSDIGISHDQGIWSTDEFYKPAEIYQYNTKEDLGTELAMIQHFDGAELREWHLNQDLVFALGLLREGDAWVRPLEDYAPVVRLRRDAGGKPIALEIKNEYLRDYLCARGYFLRISWYRTRNAIVTDVDDAGSPQEKRESQTRSGSNCACILCWRVGTAKATLPSSTSRAPTSTPTKTFQCQDRKPTTTSRRRLGPDSGRANGTLE